MQFKYLLAMLNMPIKNVRILNIESTSQTKCKEYLTRSHVEYIERKYPNTLLVSRNLFSWLSIFSYIHNL